MVTDKKATRILKNNSAPSSITMITDKEVMRTDRPILPLFAIAAPQCYCRTSLILESQRDSDNNEVERFITVYTVY